MTVRSFNVLDPDGIGYTAVKLAGPEALCGFTDSTWDYKANPYGPGTLGYNKSNMEIEGLKNRYVLIGPEDTDAKYYQYQLFKQVTLITKFGVYDGAASAVGDMQFKDPDAPGYFKRRPYFDSEVQSWFRACVDAEPKA